jgi:hypothetical protein
MFGESFYWWYVKSYEDQLIRPKGKKEKWQAAHHIEKLWDWFKSEADPNDIERWRKRVNEMPDPI